MRQLSYLLILTLALVLIAGCSKDNDGDGDVHIISGKRTYTGSATTTIEYWDYDVLTDTDMFIEEKTFNYDVLVVKDAPLSLEGVDETNPFNLQIYPDRQNNQDEEGHLDVGSCIIVNDMFVGKVILQYWNYSLIGDTFSGTLTDTHIAESAAANIIWCKDDVAGIDIVGPFYMSVGTTISGTITGNNITIDLSGESTDTYRKFTCHIEAVSN